MDDDITAGTGVMATAFPRNINFTLSELSLGAQTGDLDKQVQENYSIRRRGKSLLKIT